MEEIETFLILVSIIAAFRYWYVTLSIIIIFLFVLLIDSKKEKKKINYLTKKETIKRIKELVKWINDEIPNTYCYASKYVNEKSNESFEDMFFVHIQFLDRYNGWLNYYHEYIHKEDARRDALSYFLDIDKYKGLQNQMERLNINIEQIFDNASIVSQCELNTALMFHIDRYDDIKNEIRDLIIKAINEN